MKILDKIYEDAQKSEAILGSMVKFANVMSQKLKRIRQLEKANQHKEIITLLRELRQKLRWESRGDRQFNRVEGDLVKELKRLVKLLGKEQQSQDKRFIENLDIVHNALVKLLSFFVGDAKHDLHRLMKDERLHERVPRDQKVQAELFAAIEKLEKDVNEVLRWSKSGDALLQQLQAWTTGLARKAA